jgi:hypothetical protein
MKPHHLILNRHKPKRNTKLEQRKLYKEKPMGLLAEERNEYFHVLGNTVGDFTMSGEDRRDKTDKAL